MWAVPGSPNRIGVRMDVVRALTKPALECIVIIRLLRLQAICP